jgi:hypothetical protein
VFSYSGSNPVDAQTAHDRLNLMIVRGQDPSSYIDSFNTPVIASPIKLDANGSAIKPSPLELRFRYAIGDNNKGGMDPH